MRTRTVRSLATHRPLNPLVPVAITGMKMAVSHPTISPAIKDATMISAYSRA